MSVEELIAALLEISDQAAFVELPDGKLISRIDDSEVDGGHYVVLRAE